MVLCPPYICKICLYADDTILFWNTVLNTEALQAACVLALCK